MNATGIIVCLNAVGTISSAIESVRVQRANMGQLVTADGGPADGTVEITGAAKSPLQWIA